MQTQYYISWAPSALYNSQDTSIKNAPPWWQVSEETHYLYFSANNLETASQDAKVEAKDHAHA